MGAEPMAPDLAELHRRLRAAEARLAEPIYEQREPQVLFRAREAQRLARDEAARLRAAIAAAAAQAKRERRLIGLARRQLGVPDDSHAARVHRLSGGRTRTTLECTAGERAAILAEYRAHGWRPRPPRGARTTRPPRTKAALTGKVRALLADAQRPEAYADAIARERFGVARWEWLAFADLLKLTQMLAIDQRRRARREEPSP